MAWRKRQTIAPQFTLAAALLPQKLMKTGMKIGKLIVHGPNFARSEFSIDQFSMLEPSVYHIRFRTQPGGEVREAHGLTFECSALNDLPSCPPPCPSCRVNRNRIIPGQARHCENCGTEWNDPLLSRL